MENYDLIYATEEIVEEVVILDETADQEAIAEAIASPDIDIAEVEYIPDNDDEYAVGKDELGVEVVGVVWPERAEKNKVYRYDPNGETLERGDIVLVPTRDKEGARDIIRKAAVAHGNHRVDSEYLKHPLKKIIGVVRRRVELALLSDNDSDAKLSSAANVVTVDDEADVAKKVTVIVKSESDASENTEA